MKKMLITLFFALIIPLQVVSQKTYETSKKYDVVSLLDTFSQNAFLKTALDRADSIFIIAGISEKNISKNAFRIGYLEKVFVAKNWAGNNKLPGYKSSGILTIVDFTKAKNVKRFMTIDLAARKILHNTKVSHGSANCAKKIRTELDDKTNSNLEIPIYFGNIDSSSRSSLGLVITTKEDYPENPCHICKYFLDVDHRCTMRLQGLEKNVNDSVNLRDIIIHTTGSRWYKDSASIKKVTAKVATDLENYSIEKCGCKRKPRSKMVPNYASACYLEGRSSPIGQSLGCLALPEDDHIEIMKTIKNGSLIFIYSDVIAPTSTNYFNESPIIREMLNFIKQ